MGKSSASWAEQALLQASQARHRWSCVWITIRMRQVTVAQAKALRQSLPDQPSSGIDTMRALWDEPGL